MYKSSRPWLIVGSAAVAALVLTIVRPSPEGLLGIGVGNREVRAAPGQFASKIGTHDLSALHVITWTLIHVMDDYVDPSRIHPKDMFFAALDSVQFNIPEVLVASDRSADQVTIHVDDQSQRFSTRNIDSPYRLSNTLKKVFRFMELNMNPRADLADVEYAAANGILATLDPHSNLLNPEQAGELNVNTGGEFSGLGFGIGMHKGRLTVLHPYANTPAQRAGILARDTIVRINDDVTENLTIVESMNRMRGKQGTKISLWIEREGESKLMRFDLVRDRIPLPSVQHKMLDQRVGYIKLKQFSSSTSKETKSALQKLVSAGANSFVLDLRSNPGGLLDQAIRVSDLFLDRGAIVTTVSSNQKESHHADQENTLSRAPLAVLINRNSASASEIVAGALKNLDRAIIIGDTSFGKGSVQILHNNKDGSTLKLTIAQYLTPGDLSIQGLGITPDIALQKMYVPEKIGSPDDYLRLLPPSAENREHNLKASLRSSYAKIGTAPKETLRYVQIIKNDPVSKTVNDDAKFDGFDTITEDFEMRFARDYVANFGKSTRKMSLRNADKALESPRRAERQRLHSSLQKIGIDWSDAPPRHPLGTMQTTFTIDGTSSKVRAGDTIRLRGSITNTGSHDIYQAHARILSADSMFKDREMLFGKITPGETKVWTTQVKVDDNANDRLNYLELEVTDAVQSQTTTTPLRLRIIAAPKPAFSYSHQIIDQTNQDGLVQNGETHTLRVTVRNTGNAQANEVAAVVRNISGSDVVLTKARFDIRRLLPGESKTVDFEFRVSEKTANIVAIELQVYDGTFGESVREKLKYPIRAAAERPMPASGRVKITQSSTIFEGAASDAAMVGTANRGTILNLTGQIGNWYRVEIEKGRPGFIESSHAQPVTAPLTRSGVTLTMQVTPPTLHLAIPSYETKDATYSLSGSVSDDTKVKDLYIFVSNQDENVGPRKVFYKSNKNSSSPKKLPFSAEIPIWPGNNIITIVGRENDAVQTVQSIYINQTNPPRTAKATTNSH